jgi:hypothetical protein
LAYRYYFVGASRQYFVFGGRPVSDAAEEAILLSNKFELKADDVFSSADGCFCTE